ncbi:hypothetical protein KSS87_004898 [Heliosperma pusillum]|nr:hypothetical protein KSS87_004898 [Heliosperma pusillum]
MSSDKGELMVSKRLTWREISDVLSSLVKLVSHSPICSFDGNSLKVAELLFKNGFKEAYAIKGGVRGKKGWQEIQEEFLPPAVHVFRRKKTIKSPQLEENGAASQPNPEQVSAAGSDT